MAFKLDWHGKDISDKARRAAIRGVNKTTVKAVNVAKPTTPYITGTYRRSLQARQAKARGNRVVGVWGSFDVNYALNVEMRHNVLRNAADIAYRELAKNIKEEFARA